MITLTENAHKLIYLAKLRGGSKMDKLINEFQMPLVTFNAAMFMAEELGHLESYENGQRYRVLGTPDEWQLGSNVSELLEVLKYVFQRINGEEKDLNKKELEIWCTGYPERDSRIAIEYLIDTGVLDSYELKTKTLKGKTDTYTFYSLSENAHHQWGRNQFRDKTKLVN